MVLPLSQCRGKHENLKTWISSPPGQYGTEGRDQGARVWAWRSWMLESNSTQKKETHQKTDTGHSKSYSYMIWYIIFLENPFPKNENRPDNKYEKILLQARRDAWRKHKKKFFLMMQSASMRTIWNFFKYIDFSPFLTNFDIYK